MTDIDFHYKNNYERKELEDLLQKNEDRLNSLLKFIHLRGLPEKEFIDSVLEECIRLTGSRVGYFHFINQDENSIQLFTWSKEALKDCYAEENTHYPIDQAGIWADCVRIKRPVIHNDYENEKNKKGLPEGHFPVKNHMSVPIFDGEKIVAIVGVGNKEIPYDESDVQQLNLYSKIIWNIIKQNRSEQELIKLAAIVENSNDGIIGLNLDGLIESWNLGAERIYGYPKHEIINQSILLLLPPNLSKIVRKNIKKLIRGEFIEQFEVKNIRKDGEEIIVSLSISPIKDLTGVVIGISLITRDITEHKRMEENYRDLYEDAPNAYFSIGKDKSIRKCNKIAEKLLGYAKKELLRMKVFDLYAQTQEGLTKAKKIFKLFMQGGKIQDEELQMQKKSGEIIWISLSVKSILNNEGKVVESRSMVLDITERKTAEQKLKEYQENLELKIEERTNDLRASEHELKIIYENAPVLMVLVDEERRVRKANNLTIEFANRVEEEMLGLRGGEALRCLNALNDPRGCGFSSECQLCNVRNTVLETFKTNTSIDGVEARLPFRRENQKKYLNLIVSSVPVEIQGEKLALVTISDISNLKEAELKLRESEEKYRHLFMSNLDGISMTDMRGRFVDSNQAFLDMLGYTIEELKTLTIKDVTPEKWYSDETKAVDEIVKKSYVNGYEKEFIKKDGTSFLVNIKAFIVKKPNGEPSGIWAIIREITERKKAYEALQESEERFRKLTEQNLMGIAIKQEGRYVYLNQEFSDIVEYPKKEMLNWDAKEMEGDIHPDDFEFVRERTLNAQTKDKKGIISHYSFRIITRNKKIKWVEQYSKSIIYRHRYAILIIQIDITERKKVENALQASQTELSAIYQYAPIIIILVDQERRVRKANDLARKFANRSEEEMIGLRDGEALRCLNALKDPRGCGFSAECQLCMVRYTVLDTFKTNASIHDIEAKLPFILNNKKQDLSLIISSVPLEIKGEKLALVTITDITNLKLAEENLKKLMLDLKRSNTELEQFAYVASHDLQEPLRMIASFAQLIEKRYRNRLDEDANDFLTFIVDGAKRLQILINDLLAFSRVGTLGKPFKGTDTNRVVSNVKSNLITLIEESNAMISTDPLPIVIGDEAQLTQVFQNLISNAIKFHREGVSPQVHISGIEKKNRWIFSVKDNGIGIGKDNFDRIFVIFQRLHKRNEYGGTGIGLAICKKIIQRHGGKIWVDSEMGKGSTFRFSILKREIG